jgi:hypothetical protein
MKAMTEMKTRGAVGDDACGAATVAFPTKPTEH